MRRPFWAPSDVEMAITTVPQCVRVSNDENGRPPRRLPPAATVPAITVAPGTFDTGFDSPVKTRPPWTKTMVPRIAGINLEPGKDGAEYASQCWTSAIVREKLNLALPDGRAECCNRSAL